MASRTLFDKFEQMQARDLRRWLGWLFVSGSVVIAGVFAAYVFFFSSQSFVVDSGAWGAFGDFVGGTANPVLGFLTLTAFILTLLLQNRQLEMSAAELKHSMEELAATRAELERAAKAQELSEQALRSQAGASLRSADLSTLSFLLQSYRSELHSYEGKAFLSIDPKAQRPQELRQRLDVLEAITDNLFDEVTKRND
jgi:hypothetical protein